MVIVEILLSNRGVVVFKVTCEWDAEHHGLECLVKVHQGPIGCLQDVCYQEVNDVPYGVVILILIHVELGHGTDEVHINEVEVKKHDGIIIGAAFGNIRWEQGCWELG